VLFIEETPVSNSTPENQEKAAKPRPRRLGLLLGWFGLLVAICIGLKWGNDDPGVGNIATYVAIGLASLGFAVWSCICTGWGLKKKLLIGLAPFYVIAGFLSIFVPITDGALGIIGWRLRWVEPDRQLEALTNSDKTTLDWQTTTHDYPRFLGNGYWAEVPGVTLETDWETNPPRELWRKKIGAGWSAFAVVGNYAVTQEQRGDQELVTCYEVKTGEVAWTHADSVRWDPLGAGSMGYAGPRATPTVYEGRVFAMGATGILNCIEAATGKLLWSHDTLAKHNAINVTWGKSGSPLIVGERVVVSVGGEENQSLVAYEIESGEVAWAAGTRQSSYASPVLAQIAGQAQVLSVNEGFVTAHNADSGDVLWEYEWPSDSGADAATSQPVPLPGDRVFFSKGYGHGSALVQITRKEDGAWQTDPVWNSSRPYGELPVMKTKMSNILVRDGYVYGLDDVNLQCIELETGKKRWKKRRSPKFGYGQVMLIGDVILVTTEFGEVLLAEASHKGYKELASMQVFSDSQITWNNPAFSTPYLLVRNAEEAACYELPLKELVASQE
jgi:outer membrane protein assembly factor BamB